MGQLPAGEIVQKKKKAGKKGTRLSPNCIVRTDLSPADAIEIFLAEHQE